MIENASPLRAWTWRWWLLAACCLALPLGIGIYLGATEYVYFVTWIHLLVVGELSAVIVLGACLVRTDVKHRQAYLLAGLALHLMTVGMAVSVNKLQHSKNQERYTSLGTNPEARERLPALQNLLYDGAWASKRTLRFLEDCRQDYPTETKDVDTYIAAWYFWHKDAERGEAALRRLGRDADLIRYYELHGQWDKIEQTVRDPQAHPAGRVGACLSLARRAESMADVASAKGYYLEALERCPDDPSAADLRKATWQTVRDRLGKTISRQQYVASLNSWATRVTDQAVLESIVFELGKLQFLEKLPGRMETKQ